MKSDNDPAHRIFCSLREDGEHSSRAVNFHKKGDIVYQFNGTLSGKRTRESIEIEKGLHIFDPVAQFINHSFRPNTSVMGDTLIAKKEISPGDEITFDYTKNESEIVSPFICSESGLLVDSKLCGK